MNVRMVSIARICINDFYAKGHALTKQEIKEELYAQLFDFEQIKQDSKMFNDIQRKKKKIPVC